MGMGLGMRGMTISEISSYVGRKYFNPLIFSMRFEMRRSINCDTGCIVL